MDECAFKSALEQLGESPSLHVVSTFGCDRTNEDIISMDNGCVCCTVRGDLVEALKELAKRKDTLDAVLIETTGLRSPASNPCSALSYDLVAIGLADPAPVCFTFQSDVKVACNYRVDGIVTLVDCVHIAQHLEEERPDGTVNEAVQQVAFADRILINKTDLATAEQIAEVKATCSSINSYAEQIETNQDQRVDLDRILGLSAFSLERAEGLSEWTEEPEEEPVCEDETCTLDHSHGHGHGHGHAEPEVRKAASRSFYVAS